MAISERENKLRALEKRNPEWIPCSVGISLTTWLHYGEKPLRPIVKRYEHLITGEMDKNPNLEHMENGYELGDYRDNWGNLWRNVYRGAEGVVVEGPLEDESQIGVFQPPDLETLGERGPRDWKKIEADIKAMRTRDEFTVGEGGRLFDMMYFLRGYENLMIDIALDSPNVPKIVDMLWEYDRKLIRKWLDIGVDLISFHTDIGTQNALMIAPDKFRKYLKPWFKDIFTTIRKEGTHVHLSSDGYIGEIIDDLIECGISSHDPQYRAFGIDRIQSHFLDKPVCCVLDLDRQLFPFCTPEEAYDHVREGVTAMARPEGGLQVQASINGATPLDNIVAICEAADKYCIHWKG